MNKELLLETIETKEKVRKKILKKDGAHEFSWVSYFAGEEYNQELTQNKELQKKINDNVIDFGQLGNERGDFVEKKITEIYSSDKNKQLIEKGDCPIIWFKNIEKIKGGSSVESALLPVLDPQQNTKLFSQDLDLSKYILIATSSTRDMGKLSPPLTSRLDCINVKTAEPKKFFLDKYYGWILAGSIFLVVILLLVIFWPNRKAPEEKIN